MIQYFANLWSRGRRHQTQQNVPQISIINSNLSIRGNLKTGGEIHINGAIFGDIQASKIIVGEKGSISGGIITDTIKVHGFIGGDIIGRIIELKMTGHVIGDTEHDDLIVEKGACLNGNFKSKWSESI